MAVPSSSNDHPVCTSPSPTESQKARLGPKWERDTNVSLQLQLSRVPTRFTRHHLAAAAVARTRTSHKSLLTAAAAGLFSCFLYLNTSSSPNLAVVTSEPSLSLLKNIEQLLALDSSICPSTPPKPIPWLSIGVIAEKRSRSWGEPGSTRPPDCSSIARLTPSSTDHLLFLSSPCWSSSALSLLSYELYNRPHICPLYTTDEGAALVTAGVGNRHVLIRFMCGGSLPPDSVASRPGLQYGCYRSCERG